MDKTEKRIKALEHENNARKASYPVAGSLVSFVGQVSQNFVRSGGENISIDVRIRFTPNTPSPNGKYIINLEPEVFLNSGMTTRWPRFNFVNEPQSGDGSVVVRLLIHTVFMSSNYYFRVTATGSSEGTFAII